MSLVWAVYTVVNQLDVYPLRLTLSSWQVARCQVHLNAAFRPLLWLEVALSEELIEAPSLWQNIWSGAAADLPAHQNTSSFTQLEHI